MKNLLIIIALCYTQTLMAQSKKDTHTTIQLVPLTTKSIDPVCRMRLRRGAVDSIDYQGVRYGFCDTICKNKFLKNPKTFIKD
jgi:YHS domain-containing protein